VLVQPRAFVLEIGTEELPPRDVVEATEQVNMPFHPYLKNMMTLALQIFLP
jgi:glycyl-tRNA synthetase beta subunit